MKHAFKVTAALFTVFVLVAGGFCAFVFGVFEWNPEAVYYRFFYSKDRVTAHLLVTVDGQEQPIDESAVRCFYDVDGSNAEPLSVTAEGNALRVSTPAAAYGIYRLYFAVQTYAFDLELVHFNWWDVYSYDVVVDVDTQKQAVTISGNYTHLDESAKKVEEPLYKTQTLSAKNCFYLGE